MNNEHATFTVDPVVTSGDHSFSDFPISGLLRHMLSHAILEGHDAPMIHQVFLIIHSVIALDIEEDVEIADIFKLPN